VPSFRWIPVEINAIANLGVRKRADSPLGLKFTSRDVASQGVLAFCSAGMQACLQRNPAKLATPPARPQPRVSSSRLKASVGHFPQIGHFLAVHSIFCIE
jgi:hypothetical protein